MPQPFTIWYGEHESGPAQVIEGTVVRLEATPIDNDELFQGSIVRINHLPDKDEPMPRIVEVLWNPYPEKSILRVPNVIAAMRLMLQGVDMSCDFFPPFREGQPGLLVVGHSEEVDPRLIAEGVGISQRLEKDKQETPTSPQSENKPSRKQEKGAKKKKSRR